MAPNRARPTEDSRSESSSATAKNPGGPAPPPQAKGRRAAANNGGGASAGGSNLKDVTSAADGAAEPGGLDAAGGESVYSGINWTTVDPAVLNAYRQAHRLQTPTAFADYVDQTLLTHPRGVGRFSPTMARRRARRRVGREQLALAVRGEFNAAAVNETEVVTSFLYAVRNQHKQFRMRFGPNQAFAVTKRGG